MEPAHPVFITLLDGERQGIRVGSCPHSLGPPSHVSSALSRPIGEFGFTRGSPYRVHALRLAHRRQQVVQQPHPCGQVEQVDEVAGAGLGSRPPASHQAGVDLQQTGQPHARTTLRPRRTPPGAQESPPGTPPARRDRPTPAGVPSPLLPCRRELEPGRQQHVAAARNPSGPQRHRPYLVGGGHPAAAPLRPPAPPAGRRRGRTPQGSAPTGPPTVPTSS